MKKLLLFMLFPVLLMGQTQIGEDIDGETAEDFSGFSVSLSSDGNIIAIGAPFNDGNGDSSGHVRIFSNSAGSWTQMGEDIEGAESNDDFGSSVSLNSDGNIVAVSALGAEGNDGNGSTSGSVRVFLNDSGVWTQIGGDIDEEVSNIESFRSVSLSSAGDVIAVGARRFNGNGESSGRVRIFENLSGVWTQIGDDINGEASGDFSGDSVSLSSDGNVIAIGAPGNDGNGNSSAGQVRVFENLFGVWTQVGSDIEAEANGDNFGGSVSLSSDGSIVAIGAVGNDGNGSASGSVRVFSNESGVWGQIGGDIDGEGSLNFSGFSISLSSDGSIVAIGAISNNGNGSQSGHVRIYINNSGVWTQVGNDIDGDDSNDGLGRSVSLSSDGSIVAIGARGVSGYVRVFDLSALLSTPENNTTSFNIYPNPASNQVTIQVEDDNTLEKVGIYNNLGQLVLSDTKKTIDTSSLSTGVYVVQIETAAGKGVQKLIID